MMWPIVTCRFCRREVEVGCAGFLVLHLEAADGDFYCAGSGLTTAEAT